MADPERKFARRVDLVSLRLFVAVYELGSIGRAAEREFIAASAVSKRLAELEHTVGTDLLERHSRGVTLTPAGESLLHHARDVLFSLEKMQSELGEYGEGVRGHVRIHASTTAIVQFLPEDLGSFVAAHPQVKIDLEERAGPRVASSVRDGAASIGVCHHVMAEEALQAGDAPLQSLPYREDRLVLVVPHGHELAGESAVDFAAALDYDMVGFQAATSIGLTMQRAASVAGRTLKLRIQVTGLDAMCRMIDNGMGVGVMPDRAMRLMSGLGSLHAIALNDTWARRELRLIARDFSALPATARLLVEHLQKSPHTSA